VLELKREYYSAQRRVYWMVRQRVEWKAERRVLMKDDWMACSWETLMAAHSAVG
jgi:hypothetical protein